MKPSGVWVLETNPDGHRLAYVAAILERARAVAPGLPTLLVTRQAVIDSPQWAVHLPGYRGAVRVLPGWDAAAARRLARDAVAADARLVIPDADAVLPWLIHPLAWPALRDLRASLLLMRPYRRSGARGRAAHAGKLMLAAAVHRFGPRVAVLALAAGQPPARPGADRPARRIRPFIRNPVTWIPDLLSFRSCGQDREGWYRGHGLDPGQVSYLVIGDLSERKSVPQIVRAWSRARPAGARLLLVGTPEDAVRRAVGRLPADLAATIVLLEGYLSEQDFDAWVAHADAILLVHRNEGASGVLAKAAAAGTPVLVGGAVSLVEAARSAGVPAHLVEASEAGLEAALGDRTLPSRLREAAARRGRPPVVPSGSGSGSGFADALLGLEGWDRCASPG